MMQRIVHHIVEDVESECTRDDPIGNRFREDQVRQVGKWRFEDKEQRRRHDEPESVHREVMVDSVEEEMEHKGPVGIGEVVVDVEEEAVEGVFEDRPDDVAGEEGDEGFGECRLGGEGQGREGGGKGEEVAGGDGAGCQWQCQYQYDKKIRRSE